MTARQYATPLAFKQALEQRLKSSSATGVDFARRRQLLVFDRFLVRLAQVPGDAVALGVVAALEPTPGHALEEGVDGSERVSRRNSPGMSRTCAAAPT